jgi:tetratricopeptide (TPR) repeat protein
MKQIVIILSLIIGFSSVAFAQKQVRKDIREGNKEYKQEKFTDAEVEYRKALETNARSIEAAFNLGNALYKQSKMQEAFGQYQTVINNETDRNKLSQAWHNVGNIFMFAGEYAKSIDAYKNALRNNPKDDETRYNLALAQKLLEEQEQEEDKGEDENQEDQQQQQDQQNQEQNQDQQQQKEQEQNQQEQQPNPNEMSKENAERILDALMRDERNTQEKVKAEQMKQQQQRKTDKNW